MPKDDVDCLARMFRALGNPHCLRLFMNLLEESKLDLAKGRIHDCFLVKLLAGIDLGAVFASALGGPEGQGGELPGG